MVLLRQEKRERWRGLCSAGEEGEVVWSLFGMGEGPMGEEWSQCGVRRGRDGVVSGRQERRERWRGLSATGE